MPPKQISQKTADTIISAVDKLCDLVEDGRMSATAAGVKVATDAGLTADQVKLCISSYNAGLINTQRQDGKKFSEKFAVLDLADADKIIGKVFPGSPKAAAELSPVADVYARSRPQTLSKAAGEKKSEPYRVARCECGCGEKQGECADQNMSDYAKAKREVQKVSALRRELHLLETKANCKVAAVRDVYFSHYGDRTEPLAWLRKFASDTCGKTGGLLIDRVAREFLGPIGYDKYAAECEIRELGKVAVSRQVSKLNSKVAVDPEPRRPDHPVILAVKTAVDAMKDWIDREREFPKTALELRRKAQDHLSRRDKQSRLMLLPPGMSKETFDDVAWRKRSSMLSMALGGAIANSFRSAAGEDKPDGPSENSQMSARLQLNDPNHESEIRRIEAEAMLNSLVNDDDVISSYTPDDIALAYEEIGQSSPGVVGNPVLLRAHMRRQLQGNLTPMEADSLVSSGKNVEEPALPSPVGAKPKAG